MKQADDKNLFLRRIRTGALLLCLLLGLVLAGCTVRPRPAKTEDGRLLYRVGYIQPVNSLNPYIGTGDAAETVFALLYETLFTRDPDTGEIVGGLCTQWTVEDASPGRRVWTLTIRTDVSFSDGEPLTTRDVEFSLQSLKELSAAYSCPLLEQVDVTGIAVRDDWTISFVTWAGDECVLENLCTVPIVPEHVWNNLPGMNYYAAGLADSHQRALESLAAAPLNARTMVGSGLFEWVSGNGESCTLQLREEHRLGKSRAEVLEFRFGLADGVEQLQAGKLDMLCDAPVGTGAYYFPDGGIHSTDGLTGELFLLEFNQFNEDSGGNPLLRERTVREAVAACADREVLSAALGGALPADSILWPETMEVAPLVGPTDPAALLDKAGYQDLDGDDIRESPDGEPLSFTLLYPESGVGWSEAAEQLAASCRDAGIELLTECVSPEQLAEAVALRDYDVLLTAVELSRDGEQTLSCWYWNEGCNVYSRVDAFGRLVYPGWNECGYESSEFDEQFEKLFTVRGVQKRLALVKTMDSLLREDAAVFPIGCVRWEQLAYVAWDEPTEFPDTGLYLTSENAPQFFLGLK